MKNEQGLREGLQAGIGAMRGKALDKLGRGERSPLAVWFWEIDRILLAMVIALIAIGLLSVTAASPATAQRLSDAETTLDPLYFFWKQLFWVAVSVPAMLIISMLPRQQARRLAIVGFVVFLGMLFLTLMPVIGIEVNGSKRWIGYGAARIQPSEFLKPCFAVTVGWILSLKVRDAALPLTSLTIVMTGLVAMLLMLQPDLGQTIVICGIWFVIMLTTGLSMRLVTLLGALGIGGMVAAYIFYPVARMRIDGWLFGGEANDHMALAHKTLTAGGLIGTGPGLGQKKFALPEAHTDYIFSVIGEEFGLLACVAIALLFFAIIFRVLIRLLEEEDLFVILATTGLVTQFGGQAIINMAVNLHLFPSKGMTLPFVSYGGSSMLALALTMGLILAFTKRNPYLDRSRYIVKGRPR